MSGGLINRFERSRDGLRSLGGFVLTCIALAGCTRSHKPVGLPPRPELSGHPTVLVAAVESAEADLQIAPEESAAWLKLGQLYHANGFLTEARACYEKVATDEQLGARASYHLADVAMYAGDPGRQLHWLAETVRLAPAYTPAQLQLAEVRYKSGDVAAAIEGFERVLQREPDSPAALIGLAREHMRNGREPAATEMLERLIAAHPDHSTALSLLAQLAERRGEADHAAELRERSRLRKDPPPRDPWMDDLMRSCFDVQRLGIRFEDFVKSGRQDDGVATLRQIEAVDPAHWLVCWMRALAAGQQQRPRDAVHEYERALLAGGDAAKIQPALAAARASLGQQLLERDDPAAAVAPLAAAHAFDPANHAFAETLALAHLRVGNRAAKAGRFDEAIASYDAAIAVRPKMAELYANKVQVHLQVKQYDAAEQAMLRLSALRPENAAVFVSLGDIQSAAGKTAAAKASWRKALELLGENDNNPLRDALVMRLAETASSR